MHRLTCLILATITMLFFTFYSEQVSAQERFIWISSDELRGYYFDTDSIAFLNKPDSTVDKNIVNVWVKTCYTPAGIEDEIYSKRQRNLSTQGYQSLDLTMAHWQIDLSQKRLKLIERIDYTKSGDILVNFIVPIYMQRWDNVVPETAGEDIWNSIFKYANETMKPKAP